MNLRQMADVTRWTDTVNRMADNEAYVYTTQGVCRPTYTVFQKNTTSSTIIWTITARLQNFLAHLLLRL